MSIVNNLPEYVKANGDELLVKAALGTKTLDIIAIYPDVKFKTALNYLDSTVVLDNGEACGFEAKGSDVLSNRYLEVKPIRVNKEFCYKTLAKTAANHQMLFEAGRETLPFEEKFTESNLKAIGKQLESLIWNGDGTLVKGFLPLMDEEAGVIKAELAAGSNIVDAVDKAYASLPAEALDMDAVIFMSMTQFRAYVTALNATCCANRQPYDAAAGEVAYPVDSRVRIVAVPGLEGFTGVVAGPAKNFIYGTDIEGSEAVYKLWFSDDDDVFKFKVLFNAGVQILYPADSVKVTIAA